MKFRGLPLNIKERKSYIAESETLSDRLLYALEILKVTQATLARSLNVKPQAINFLCKSKTRKSQLTYEIADALGISADWLANGVGYMRSEEDPQYQLISSQTIVPIVSTAELKNLFKKNVNFKEYSASTKGLMTDANTGQNGFAIELTDKSMYPRFDIGTILIFNSDKSPKINEFVLTYVLDIDDIIFRQLEIIDGVMSLRPLNSSIYKNVFLSENDSIIGTLTEARWQI